MQRGTVAEECADCFAGACAVVDGVVAYGGGGAGGGGDLGAGGVLRNEFRAPWRQSGVDKFEGGARGWVLCFTNPYLHTFHVRHRSCQR